MWLSDPSNPYRVLKRLISKDRIFLGIFGAFLFREITPNIKDHNSLENEEIIISYTH